MTVINAITPSGRHIKAAMNTAAINTPTAVATGRLRFAGCAAERGLLTARPAGCPPRRRPVCTGGRRGMPDGSVPIVIRDGSRAATGSSSVGITSCCPVRRTPGPASAPGSVGESSFHTGDSEVNDDQTSSSSSVPSPGTVTSASGSRSRRGSSPVGGSVQCGSDPVSLAPNVRPSSTASWSRVGSCSSKSGSSSSSSRSRRQVSSVIGCPFPVLSSVMHELRRCRLSGAQTSRSSCSLRPNAPSMRSTCS